MPSAASRPHEALRPPRGAPRTVRRNVNRQSRTRSRRTPRAAQRAPAPPPAPPLLEALIARVPAAHRQRVRDLLALSRVDRPAQALFLLWPAWWALWLAAGDFPRPGLLAAFTLAAFLAHGAAATFNDLVDRKRDAAHPATAQRPLAAGRLGAAQALALLGGLMLPVLVLLLFSNGLTQLLAAVAALLLALDPFAKRWTHLAPVVRGSACAWVAPLAFAASGAGLPPLCWLLLLAIVLFTVMHETERALALQAEAAERSGRSILVLFGDLVMPILAILAGGFVLAMALVGNRAALGWPWWLATGVAATLLGYQLWLLHTAGSAAAERVRRGKLLVGGVFWAGALVALAL